MSKHWSNIAMGRRLRRNIFRGAYCVVQMSSHWLTLGEMQLMHRCMFWAPYWTSADHYNEYCTTVMSVCIILYAPWLRARALLYVYRPPSQWIPMARSKTVCTICIRQGKLVVHVARLWLAASNVAIYTTTDSLVYIYACVYHLGSQPYIVCTICN